MEHPEVWVTIRSLRLFLKYYENPSKRVWLKRPLNYIEEDEVRAYRTYVSSRLDQYHLVLAAHRDIHPHLGPSTTPPTIPILLCS